MSLNQRDQLRSRVLELLETAPEAISGQEIAERLGISRTAVWKHIQALRRLGYSIEGRSRAGYYLTGRADVLGPEEIRRRLSTRFLGRQVLYYPLVGSTNDVAKEVAEKGAPEGTLVVADQQSAGRGRLKRSWFSPPGSGIWMSLILRPRVSLAQAPRYTLVVGVAVAEAIRSLTGLAAGIKWPNDVLIRGRKVAGILTELRAEPEAVAYAIVGVGINVSQPADAFPPELRGIATSIAAELGQAHGSEPAVTRAELIADILNRLEADYLSLPPTGLGVLRQRWVNLSVTLGEPVAISDVGGEIFRGRAVDLQEDGSLVVEGERGERRAFIAGEVTLLRLPGRHNENPMAQASYGEEMLS